MKKQIVSAVLCLTFLLAFIPSCQKEKAKEESILVKPEISGINKSVKNKPSYNLEVVLHGDKNRTGHIHFRQDSDPEKIITLDIKVQHLLPHHEYLLQRAVDGINNVDGNCTSSAWLTLGHGLTPQSIVTDDKGNGQELLWRDVTAIPSGSMFDIHFQVIDAVSKEPVLTSDCYQYTVR